MRKKRLSNDECLVLRLQERDDCAHYSQCLHEVAKTRSRYVPCQKCDRYEQERIKPDPYVKKWDPTI